MYHSRPNNNYPEIVKFIDDSMIYEHWLNTFINENDLDRKHVFEIENEETVHTMEFEVLVGSIIALPVEYQKKIKDKLVGIDSENGDLLHYFDWIAEGFIKYKLDEVISENK